MAVLLRGVGRHEKRNYASICLSGREEISLIPLAMKSYADVSGHAMVKPVYFTTTGHGIDQRKCRENEELYLVVTSDEVMRWRELAKTRAGERDSYDSNRPSVAWKRNHIKRNRGSKGHGSIYFHFEKSCLILTIIFWWQEQTKI